MKAKFETLAIKSVENDFKNALPVSTPIYLSSTYERKNDGSYSEDLIYSRNGNPNRNILEKSISTLESAEFGIAFSSGMAAVNAVFQCLEPNDHVILPNDIYYAIKKLMDEIFHRWNLTYDLVEMTDLESIKNSIKQNTKLIWIETPSNPQLKISDIKSICSLAKKNDILSAVDNTWATPVLQNPIILGADIVMHSSTKYFGGHSDVLGGIIVTNKKTLADEIRKIQVLSGAVPSPFDCWLIARGIQTLHLRVTKQSENALKLAKYFEKHPKIEKVNYPGLIVSQKNITSNFNEKNGFGAMLSILIKGDKKNAFKISTKLNYFKTATSLGGVESLVEHRKSVEGPFSSTPENLLRISVGIEHIDDLISDWEQALA